MKKDVFTTVEITDSDIKILQARWQKNTCIYTACHILPLKDNTSKNTALALKEFASKKDIDIEDVSIVIPRRNIILKRMLLPSHADTEVRRMISLQLVNQVPYPREDIIFDYLVIEKENSGYSKVLAVIVHRDTVYNYLKVLNQAGWTCQKFIISALGVLEWFLRYGKIENQTQPFLVIDVDPHASEICFIQNDKLLFSRNTSFGCRDFGKESLSQFVDQIGLTLGAYKKETMGEEIGRIIIASGSQDAVFLKEELTKYYKLPIEVVSVVKTIQTDKNLSSSQFREGEGYSFLSLMGGLLPGHQSPINLMPQEVLDIKQMRKKRQALIQLLVSFAVAITLSVGAMGVGVYQDYLYLEQLKEHVKMAKTKVGKAEEKMQFVRFVKERLSNRVLMADIMKELYELTPDDVFFRSLNLDQRGALAIQGFSDKGSSVSEFQKGLVGSSLFRNVSLEYATKRKRYKTEYTDFKIVCQLSTQAGSTGI